MQRVRHAFTAQKGSMDAKKSGKKRVAISRNVARRRRRGRARATSRWPPERQANGALNKSASDWRLGVEAAQTMNSGAELSSGPGGTKKGG